MTTTTYTEQHIREYRLLRYELFSHMRDFCRIQRSVDYDRCVTSWAHQNHLVRLAAQERRANAAQDRVWAYERAHPGIKEAGLRYGPYPTWEEN